jgi:hypothetical protein
MYSHIFPVVDSYKEKKQANYGTPKRSVFHTDQFENDGQETYDQGKENG